MEVSRIFQPSVELTSNQAMPVKGKQVRSSVVIPDDYDRTGGNMRGSVNDVNGNPQVEVHELRIN